jgi:hypothetical protein
MCVIVAVDGLVDHLIGDIPAGRTEVASRPEVLPPIALPKLWKLLLYLP